MRTIMKMNVEKYLRHAGGDTAIELLVNGLDSNATFTKVTRSQEERTFTVEDNGEGFPSMEAIDKYLCTIMSTSKDEGNFGKGFKSALKEAFVEVWTNQFYVLMKAWDDITITELPSHYNGTKVTVHLKESSELLSKTDSEFRIDFKHFLTSKEIWYNGERLQTSTWNPDTWFQIMPKIWVKYGETYHGFLMYGGKQVRPCKYTNCGALLCGIVVGDINYVDTERSVLNYSQRGTIERWVDNKRAEECKDGAVDITNLSEYITKAKQFISDKCVEHGGDIPEFTAITTIEQVFKLEMFFDEFKEFDKGASDLTSPEYNDDQKQYRKFGAASFGCGDVSEFLVEFLGGDLVKFMPDMVIGLLMEGSEVLSSQGTFRDLAECNYRSYSVSRVWDRVTDTTPSFIAEFHDVDSFVETTTTQPNWSESDTGSAPVLDDDKWKVSPGNKAGLAESITPMAMEIVEKLINDSSAFEPDEREPEWTLEDRSGIPILVHNSIDKLTIDIERQRKKYEDFRNVTVLVMEYVGVSVGMDVYPVLFVSDAARHRNAVAMTHGNCLGISARSADLPKNPKGRAVALLDHVVHELAHFKRHRDDRKFGIIRDSLLNILLKEKSFVDTLFKVVS